MAPATPFNASELTEKARRDLLLLLEGVRQPTISPDLQLN
jgi:hypothetical protein